MSASGLAIGAAPVFAWETLSARLERFEVAAPITFVLVGVLVSGVGVMVVWPDVVLTLRLGAKLEIALCTAPPHPAVRHPIRMAIKRKRP